MEKKSYIHKPATKPMDCRILAQLHDYNTGIHPQAEAFIIYDNYGQRTVHTFQEVKDRSLEIADLLLQIGITRGQRVALMAPNCVEFVWSFLALNRIGANVILIPMYGGTAEAVSAIIKRLKCKSFLMFPSGDTSFDQQLLKKVRKTLDEGKIVNIGPEDLKSLLETTAKLMKGEVYKHQEKVQFDDPAVVLFTSGSTGEPKAIQYTNHALTNAAFAHGMKWFGIREHGTPRNESRVFNDRPFSYAACILLSLNIVFVMGTTLVSIPPTAAVKKLNKTDYILRVLQDEKCTYGVLLPYLICDVVNYPKTGNFDLKNLKVIVTGGQPIPPALLLQLKKILPDCTFYFVYGLSEALWIAGKPFDDGNPDAYDNLDVNSGTEIKIVNTKKEVVHVGERGEICVRCQLSFCGYLEDPKANMRDIDQNDWMHTDDVGFVDYQGLLHVCGRMHEVINRGIEKIYPIEVEKVLSLYCDVKGVAVMGVPDERLYEEICACVIPKTGSRLESSVTEFDQWASLQWKADDLGLNKKPRYILVFQEFPTTKTGKIDRKVLKAIAIKRLGLNPH